MSLAAVRFMFARARIPEDFVSSASQSTSAKGNTLPDRRLIRVGHSPDPDDAFMFHALTNGKIDTGRYEFRHELVDIETLNRRARQGELELTAFSIHAYAYLDHLYLICPSGASMGDGYGPMVVSRAPMALAEFITAEPPGPTSGCPGYPDHGKSAGKTIAVPGTLTSAFLALRLCLGADFAHEVVPFDQILDAVETGNYQGRPVDAGLIIHEGQLTYGDRKLHLVVDLGKWWRDETGLPLPLGANGIRKDLGPRTIAEVNALLRQSIDYALAHREEALDYAAKWGRDLDRARADKFVGMYVNQWTLDFSAKGREAVRLFLERGHQAGVIPRLVVPEFAGG